MRCNMFFLFLQKLSVLFNIRCPYFVVIVPFPTITTTTTTTI